MSQKTSVIRLCWIGVGHHSTIPLICTREVAKEVEGLQHYFKLLNSWQYWPWVLHMSSEGSFIFFKMSYFQWLSLKWTVHLTSRWLKYWDSQDGWPGHTSLPSCSCCLPSRSKCRLVSVMQCCGGERVQTADRASPRSHVWRNVMLGQVTDSLQELVLSPGRRRPPKTFRKVNRDILKTSTYHLSPSDCSDHKNE